MSLEANNLRFGEFALDVGEKVLLKNGVRQPLPPKALKVLSILIENRGHIVEKNDLLEQVWADTFVEEGNLPYTIRLLRKSLGDDADKPKYIETIPRRGYRFIAKIDSGISDTLDRRQQLMTQVQTLDGANGLFVGRTRQITDVTDLLRIGETRLVTLTGTGGTGKTTLAREVGRRVSSYFPDGVFFVELESITDPNLLATFLANALGVFEPGHRSILDVLADSFRGMSALLILDNFEQIVDAAPSVAQLLKQSSPLKVLVTSREPLKLKIETEYKVPPLSFPAVHSDESALKLIRYEAVEFFVERARRARPQIETHNDDLRTIASICNRLDGLPLALELAAARVKVLSVPEILSKLENSLGLLTGGDRDVPNRQQTMRATISWSYDLLTEVERSVFAFLSVFEGGFTFEAAEQVLEDHESISIVDAITSLTDKGLLIAENSDGNQRFRMLVVVREFALERLAKSGEAASIASSHAKYFLDLAEEAEPQLQSSDVGPWVKRLDLEHDNLRAVMKWSMIADREIAARVAKALRLFWMLRGYTREAQYWYREILKASNVPGQYRWILLTGLANMSQFRGDLVGAEKAYRESLVESRILDEPKRVAQSLRGVAAAVYMQGDTAAAKELINEALSISRGNDDAFGEAAALARLGDIALKEADASEARLRGEQALEIFRRVGFQPGICSKLMNLGVAEIADGAFESAREHLHESLQIALKSEDYITTRLTLEGFSWLCFEAGDHFNAARLTAAAFRMGDEIDHLLEPAESRMRELYLDRLKNGMGERAFELAYSRGLEIPRSEAIAIALGSIKEKESKLRLVKKSTPKRQFRAT